jgi:hypothetical protein
MLGLDFSNMSDLEVSRNVVREVFPIQSEMQLYEAYTETWASIINTCFCSYFCFDNMGKVTFVSYAEVLLGFESAWRIFQMHKILRFMGLTYSDLFSTSKKAVLARAYLYREDTNVFAYYVITALLLVSYGDFMEWCSTNNGVGGNMSFHKTTANTVAFAHFITTIHSTAATRKNVRDIGAKKCFNAILGGDSNLEDATWVSETMRMSACEMC